MSRADELPEFSDTAGDNISRRLVAHSRQSCQRVKRSWLMIGEAREQENIVDLAAAVEARKLKRR